MDDKELEALRGGIDRVDDGLLELLRERMRLAGEIGAWKRRHGLPVRDPAREEELLSRVADRAGGELAGDARVLFETLLALSRARQERIPRLRCGLIGEKLGHSYSPAIHALLGDYDYRLIELSPDGLGPFLKAGAFDGLNVTIPYKKAVLPFCTALTERAARIGCVNTVVRREDGSLLGDNTDYAGFLWLLRRSGLRAEGKKALVLGSGGASLTVGCVLRDRGAKEIVTVSRGGPVNYENLYEQHSDAALLVNATPVGMFPQNGACAVELSRLPALEGVIDLIYNPARTKLLLDAERLGLPAVNGLGMLAAQAAAASELFTGRRVDEGAIDGVVKTLERENLNLLLIGMPGCGKSTVGAALARRTGRPFADCDALIEQRAGRSIPAIFAEEGEEGFRRREHALLEELTKRSGLVIACGGGVLTVPENLDLLRQNGIPVWLLRDLNRLPAEGRPLSLSRPIEELWREREPLYRAAAAITADNNGTVDETVTAILEALNQ